MDTSKRFKICAKKLGAQIKSIRKAKGLTQIELAERAHMNGTYVGDVERATENISIYKLISLADALEVPVSELIKPLDDHTVSSKIELYHLSNKIYTNLMKKVLFAFTIGLNSCCISKLRKNKNINYFYI